MIQIVKNELFRGGTRIGWIDGDCIRDHAYEKVAYFTHDQVLDKGGSKVAYISGDFLYFAHTGAKSRLEDNNQVVQGIVSDICKAAIVIALG